MVSCAFVTNECVSSTLALEHICNIIYFLFYSPVSLGQSPAAKALERAHAGIPGDLSASASAAATEGITSNLARAHFVSWRLCVAR